MNPSAVIEWMDRQIERATEDCRHYSENSHVSQHPNYRLWREASSRQQSLLVVKRLVLDEVEAYNVSASNILDGIALDPAFADLDTQDTEVNP